MGLFSWPKRRRGPFRFILKEFGWVASSERGVPAPLSLQASRWAGKESCLSVQIMQLHASSAISKTCSNGLRCFHWEMIKDFMDSTSRSLHEKSE